jgi:putative hydrolase of the HAD superfamily
MQLSVFTGRKQNFSMQKVENIILDYGNVIFMIDFMRLREAFIHLGIMNVDHVFAHAGQISLFDDFDRGSITPFQFRDGIRELAGNLDLTDGEIDRAWNALLVGVPAGKHELLLRLKDRYRTFLLSNNNEIHYTSCMRHIRETYGVDDNTDFFERTYYSHFMGMRKPDCEIFEVVLRENGLAAGETLFVDDSPQHLETAAKLGMQTALCTADEPLEHIIDQWGLLP